MRSSANDGLIDRRCTADRINASLAASPGCSQDAASRNRSAAPVERRFASDDSAGGVPRLLLSPLQAAQVLGIGRSTLYGLLRSGAISSVRIGTLRRIPRQALDEFVSALASASDTADQDDGR